MLWGQLAMCNKQRSSGFTLVEMIIAITVISMGLAGVLVALNENIRTSADPMLRKQMLSIAEGVLEEILLKPYEIAGTAPVNGLANCNVVAGTLVPAAVRASFNDVRDYAGYSTQGICDMEGVAVDSLRGYDLRVTIDPAAVLSDGVTAVAGGQAIRVQVQLTHGAETLSLVGWRTNYGS